MSKEFRHINPDILPSTDVYELGTQGGFDLAISPVVLDETVIHSPILADMNAPYSLEQFQRMRTPIAIGQSALEEIPLGLRVHDVPIRFPGTEYRVPNELLCIRDTLELCASFEAAVNPDVDECFTYLTLQHSEVEPGTSQRVSTIHVDGFQGPHRQPKMRPEHGYTSVTRDPSFFYTQSHDFRELDIDQDNVPAALSQRTLSQNAIRFNPNDIVLMDGYTPHSGVIAETAGPRCFFRLRFCDPAHHANRRGRTKNPLFEAEYQQVGWKTTTYAENS